MIPAYLAPNHNSLDTYSCSLIWLWSFKQCPNQWLCEPRAGPNAILLIYCINTQLEFLMLSTFRGSYLFSFKLGSSLLTASIDSESSGKLSLKLSKALIYCHFGFLHKNEFNHRSHYLQDNNPLKTEFHSQWLLMKYFLHSLKPSTQWTGIKLFSTEQLSREPLSNNVPLKNLLKHLLVRLLLKKKGSCLPVISRILIYIIWCFMFYS